eukprot:scaffold24985_cov118-Isochrysis_galbana.AAC.1
MAQGPRNRRAVPGVTALAPWRAARMLARALARVRDCMWKDRQCAVVVRCRMRVSRGYAWIL